MNNLAKFDSQALSRTEMLETNGGFVCGGVCIGLAFAAGFGLAVYAAS